MAIITFGGQIGSGKTTMAVRVARALGYEEVYMGGIFREMARERSLSIEEFYMILQKDPILERSADDMQAFLMRQKDDIVIQGRVSFFFARQSGKKAINIFLSVDPRIAAQRKVDEGSYPGKSVGDVIALNAAREQNERERYRALYGITDHLDPQSFDIVCDTTNRAADEVFEILMLEIKKRM